MLTFNKLGRAGRLCNQMFQIAGTIGIAERLGYEFGFPYWMNWDERERFGSTEDIDVQQYFKNPLPLFEEELEEYYVKWGYHNVSPPDNVSIMGHLQSEKYFKHCEDKIRHYFTFKDETDKKTDTIAVHFRGGDYLKHPNYHPVCSTEYYRQARELFDNSFRVLLFTDSPKVARDVIPFQFELVEEQNGYRALELMTKCDAHIIANSTFSWWGAWLAESRRVVAPSKWFGHEAKLIVDDIYPEEWIII